MGTNATATKPKATKPKATKPAAKSDEDKKPGEDAAPAKTKPAAVKTTGGIDGDGVTESKRKIYTVDARVITHSLGGNHRYPFTNAMQQAGYGFFEPLPGHPDFEPLWNLGTSEDPAKRAEFLRVMELYERTNPADPTIIDLAMSMYTGVAGQLHPAQLRDNGKKNGRRTATIIAGHRRLAAVLWLWCCGLRKKPELEVFFVKGNGLELSALQKDENAQRKQVSQIIVAQGYRRSINEGATVTQVAEANGVSDQTVERWLKFLELEPTEQKKLTEGKLRHDDAVQIVDDRRTGGEGKTTDGLNAEEAAEKRPAKGGKRNRKKGKLTTKRMEGLFSNPPANWKGASAGQIKFVLGVLLGQHDDQGVTITAAEGDGSENDGEDAGGYGSDFEAVLPPEGAAIGLMGDSDGELEVEVEVDADGNIVVKS